MKRFASDSSTNCRSYPQARLLFAAFSLFALETATAQDQPPAAASAAAAAAAEPLPRISANKIAAPNALLPAPTWAKLGDAQKTALLPLAHDWDALDATRKSQWLEVATRFSTLPAEDQARLQERMREWTRLSPAERQQARIGFQGAKKITADERQAKWEAYQALPQEQRQQLADKAAKKLETQSGKVASKGGNGPSASLPMLKSNLVPAAPASQAPKAVAATLLQAKPGATTVLITQSKRPPAHQLAGNTKVLANPELVDSKTLLPKRPLPGASAP